MDIIVILVSTLFASVKCDVGLGYQYRAPATSYEVPFGSVGDLNNDRKYYHVGKEHFPTGNIVSPHTVENLVSSTPSPLLQPKGGHGNFIGGGNIASIDERYSIGHEGGIGINSVVSSTPFAYIDRQNNFVSTTPVSILQTPIHEAGDFTNVQRTQSISNLPSFDTRTNIGGSFVQSSRQSLSGPTEVQKHLYFYSAPEEEEVIHPRIIAPTTSATKNVKLLFIKAPSFKFAPVQIPSQLQNQEKTLVYVLVKKPDEPEHVVVPSADSKPQKPEVFFIKYQTQKEAQEAVSNIQQGGHNGAVSSVEYSDSGSFNSQDTDRTNSFRVGYSSGLPLSHIDDQGITRTTTFDPRFSSGFQSNILESNNLDSRILPMSPSGDFAHLNINNHVHSGISGSTTVAPESFLTIKSVLSDHDQVQGYTTPRVNAVTLPTSPISTNAGEVKVHNVYGPPK